MAHIPKPFQRPSVTVATKQAKRYWQHVPTYRLAQGDIVADHGAVVTMTIYRLSDPVTVAMSIEFQSGRTVRLNALAEVYAFTTGQGEVAMREAAGQIEQLRRDLRG